MAGTTEDKLRAALVSKENIRAAIEEKGVECGRDIPFSYYPEKILSIKTGGSGYVMFGAVGIGGKISGTRLSIYAVGKFTEISTE